VQHQQLKYGTGNLLKILKIEIEIVSELYYFLNCKCRHNSAGPKVLENTKNTYTEKYWSSALL